MNRIAEQLAKLGEEIFRELAKEVDVQQTAYLLENKEEIKTAVLRAILKEEIEKSTFRVQVDYNQTVKKMVKNGKYDNADSNITSKNFPLAKRENAKVDVHLVRFGHNVSSLEEVIRELDKTGFRPAELPELLSLGVQYPDVQREFRIVAPGSVWCGQGGYRFVPYLWSDAGGRNLGLVWFGYSWGPYYRFAAVRK